jgi:hypothetical protein
VAGLKATAERQGDHYVLNGQKKWITWAVHADVSDKRKIRQDKKRQDKEAQMKSSPMLSKPMLLFFLIRLFLCIFFL